MIDKAGSVKALQQLFKRFSVVDIKTLSKSLKTTSRMSIFRRLREIGYLSSYTNTGRYYTLSHIPQFDNYGLWFHEGIGFSRFGTLKETIVAIVEESAAGLTQLELSHILRVRVHNTLLNLVHGKRVGRELFDKVYLYVDADPDKAAAQVTKRTEKQSAPFTPGDSIPDATVIEVLLETIHSAKIRIDPALVTNRLVVRGICVTVEQVEQLFTQFGIGPGKKTAESGSIRLKP
jgi:hypothetical protein